jgi:hypothetical protein
MRRTLLRVMTMMWMTTTTTDQILGYFVVPLMVVVAVVAVVGRAWALRLVAKIAIELVPHVHFEGKESGKLVVVVAAAAAAAVAVGVVAVDLWFVGALRRAKALILLLESALMKAMTTGRMKD